MRFLLLLALVFIAPAAQAENIGWEHNLSDQQGNPKVLTDIKHYKVLRNSTQWIITPAPGSYQEMAVPREFGANRVKVIPVDQFNRDGRTSNEITLVSPSPTPLPTATATNTPSPLLEAPVISQVP